MAKKKLSNLDKLRKDFLDRHPGINYFSQKEIFQYIDMAFCIGHDEAMKIQNKTGIKVVRHDGVEYESIVRAAKKNKVSETAIRKAINKGTKSAGYYWKSA